MSKLNTAYKTYRLLNLFLLDLAVGLCFAALIYDNSRRWPILVVIVPVVLLVNVISVRRTTREPKVTGPPDNLWLRTLIWGLLDDCTIPMVEAPAPYHPCCLVH